MADIAVTFPADAQIEYIGKTGNEEEEMVRRGIDIIRMSKNVRNLVEFEWAKDNDSYDSKFDKKEIAYSEFLGVPRLFIPKTYAQTQRMMEECLEQWFFDVEEFASIRTWKSVPRETIEIVKSLINYRLNDHPIQTYQEVYEFCQDGIKNKVGIFKVYPRFKVIKGKNKRFIVNEDGEEIDPPDPKNMEEMAQFFTPVVECIPYEDIFVHVEATWKDYWKYPIVHRVKRTRDYCKKRGYKNIDQIPWAGTFPGTDLIKMQRSLNQGSPFSGAPEDIKEVQAIWIYECWDLQPGKQGYLESGSFVLGGSADRPMALMRGWVDNELPYQFDPTEPVRPPFVVGSAFPEAHQMYGKSFPGLTRDLQKETNARINQEREAVARALRPPILVNKNVNADLQGLIKRKIGGIVQANDISEEAIREMPISNPIPVSLPAQQRIDQLYTEISSIGPTEMGAQQVGSSDDSATASATQSRNANKKMNMVIRNLTQTGIIPMLRFLLRLEQEYESDAVIELVTGRTLGWKFVKDPVTGKHIGPPPTVVIQGDFDLQINIGENKQNQLAQLKTISELGAQSNGQLVQALQIGALKAQDAKFFNPVWSFKLMAKMLGQKNTDEMFMPAMQPPPPQQAQGGKGNPSPPGISGAMSPAQMNLISPS